MLPDNAAGFFADGFDANRLTKSNDGVNALYRGSLFVSRMAFFYCYCYYCYYYYFSFFVVYRFFTEQLCTPYAFR